MQDIIHLHDANGKLLGVQLSTDLWERVESHVLNTFKTFQTPSEADRDAPEPLDAWEEFKRYWDFKYPFCANVECSNCGSKCDDWEHDPSRRFTLRTANLGGLLVFRCAGCGAGIRKKHFKDHMVFEMTPPPQQG